MCKLLLLREQWTARLRAIRLLERRVAIALSQCLPSLPILPQAVQVLFLGVQLTAVPGDVTAEL